MGWGWGWREADRQTEKQADITGEIHRWGICTIIAQRNNIIVLPGTILFTFGMPRPEIEPANSPTSLSYVDDLVLVSLNAHISKWFRISTSKEVISYVVQIKPQYSLVAFNNECLCDSSACLALMKLLK